jgi:hypothetical protein
MEVAELTLKDAAAVVPNFTPVAPVKPEPAMVMPVPPLAGPVEGEIDDTTGGEVTT